MSRPRVPHGGDGGDGDSSPGRRGAVRANTGSVADGQDTARAHAHVGRANEPGGANQPGGAESPPPPGPVYSSDPETQAFFERWEALGETPPPFRIADNDAEHHGDGAHTLDRHGPEIPLERDPGQKTIEGRIHGDTGWPGRENWSYRWTDRTTMQRTIDDYVDRNWETIRTELAHKSRYSVAFDAGHLTGEGYANSKLGQGPSVDPEAQYGRTNWAQIIFRVVPGSDPPEPFIVTAYPLGKPKPAPQ